MQGTKYRAGIQGAVNVLLGTVFAPVFAVLVLVSGDEVLRGVDVGWSLVAIVAALAAGVVMVATLLSGLSSCRAVVLTATGLSLPGFTLRRGFHRETVPLGDVSDVALRYHSNPRSGRWQLVVVRRHGRPLASDSVTTSRSRTDPRGTPAWRAVQDLRTAIRVAQGSGAAH